MDLKPSRFTEELKSRSSGSCGRRKPERSRPMCAACTGATIYKWKATSSVASMFRTPSAYALEDENTKPKKL
jgi:hypothetical protein